MFRPLLKRISRPQSILLALFLISLPAVNPWVRGDGVGYYAYVRSILIEGHLNFEQDWLHANQSFQMYRIGPDGKLTSGNYTPTGQLDNHFAVGPSILWSPFLGLTHLIVLAADRFGAHVPADGFSWPYRVTMAIATALYGFLGLMISFDLARRYVAEQWAMIATIGIWFASSLAVYMYFNPSWSHAHSAFMVALFFWYWDRTRAARTQPQWLILGAIGGLVVDVYYISAILFLLPLLESLTQSRRLYISKDFGALGRLAAGGAVFSAAAATTFLPTLITRKIIYGNYFHAGYSETWYWYSPEFLNVCFSSDHGLFSWTPILLLATFGLFFLRKLDRALATYTLIVLTVYIYALGCYQNWDGISSFGNRFFVPLTSFFVLGLAAFFDFLSRRLQRGSVALAASILTFALILWNLGLMYQWGTHMIPVRGPIFWRKTVHNQVAVVPFRIIETTKQYFTRRNQLMNHIEQQDIRQLKSSEQQGTN